MRSMPSAENAADTRSWWNIDPPKAVKKLAWHQPSCFLKGWCLDDEIWKWRLVKTFQGQQRIFTNLFFWWSEIPPKINYRNEQLKFVWTFWGCLVGRLVGWYVHDCSLSLRLYFSTKCCGQQSALLRTPFGWTGILQLFLTCCFSFQGEGQERLEDLKNP